jgi:Zn-dependent protease with chaperone function
VPFFLVVGPLALLIVNFASLLPDRLDLGAVATLSCIALGVGIYLNWGARAALRGLGIIRPGSERLYSVVADAARKTGVNPRGAEQVSLPTANAMAFILERRIGVTDAALAALDDDQLAAVCAHELAHLAEPRRVILARASGPFLLGFFVAITMASVGPIARSYGPSGMLWGTDNSPGIVPACGNQSRADGASQR